MHIYFLKIWIKAEIFKFFLYLKDFKIQQIEIMFQTINDKNVSNPIYRTRVKTASNRLEATIWWLVSR